MLAAPSNMPLPIDQPVPKPGTTGVLTFLAGVTVLFAALLVAYAASLVQIRISPPALPRIFWISTFVVLISSVFLNHAAQSARAGRGDTAHGSLLAATGLGYLFVGLQGAGFVMLTQLQVSFMAISGPVFAITVALVALHLVHAIGGLAFLSLASLRSEKHHYQRGEIGQLRPLMIYWHYMAVIWVVLFTTLAVAN